LSLLVNVLSVQVNDPKLHGAYLRAQEICSMRYVLLVAIAAALAGCGDTIAGNDTGGTIEVDPWATSAAKSFPKAEKHCAQYGKRAKIMSSQSATSISYATMTFECV
jgi:hypothetical protein